MKGSFLNSAAPTPAEKLSCEGTEFFCILKTDLPWILCLKPFTILIHSNRLPRFILQTINSVIQKLQLFLFSLY